MLDVQKLKTVNNTLCGLGENVRDENACSCKGQYILIKIIIF